ncbi:hypothetical protein [Pseudescherichia vulneris]|uniref:hypothetical protein n=1 Tax=Pseudescherichia vulneris TaxID=566 RepID=UPI0036F375E5
MNNTNELTAKLKATEQHAKRGWDEAHEQEARAEAAENRIAELEQSELQLIGERDNAEGALADMYQAATGESPEWSNWFGYADAVDAVTDRIAELEARTLTVKLPPNELIVNDNTMPGDGWEVFDAQKVTDALKSACAADGIKLQIEGE